MHRLAVGLAAAAIVALSGCTTDSKVATVASEFVGSEKCGDLPRGEFKTWKDTYHSKMVRTPQDGLLKDALDNWAKDGKGNAGPTKGNIDGTPAKLDDVVYVIGSKWKQRYLVKNPETGNHQFLDKQWNRVHQARGKATARRTTGRPSARPATPPAIRITAYDPKNTAAMKVAMTEHNIGCEACHGPGAKHVGIAQEGRHLQSRQRGQGRGGQGLRLLPHPRPRTTSG